VLNEAAYGDMRKHHLSVPLIPSRACLPARLMAEPQTCFADEAAWLAHPGRLGFTALSVTPDPVRAATEGALWASVQSHKFLCDAVVPSDDAGQFNAGPRRSVSNRLGMRCAGSTPNGWCTSWIRSPTRTGRRRRGCAA
jgi:hypothetical protein